MSERKFWKRTSSFSTPCVYEVVHEGHDYVIAKGLGRDDVSAHVSWHNKTEGEFVPDPALEIKVGDYVRKRDGSRPDLWSKVIHIHQGEDDTRRWIVYAFKGDIPYASYSKDLIKKVD